MSWSANEPLTSPRSALTQGPLHNLAKLNLRAKDIKGSDTGVTRRKAVIFLDNVIIIVFHNLTFSIL